VFSVRLIAGGLGFGFGGIALLHVFASQLRLLGAILFFIQHRFATVSASRGDLHIRH